MNSPFISEEELLRICLIEKIKKLWFDEEAQKDWEEENWFKLFQKKEANNDSFSVNHLPNGFFEMLTTQINQIIANKLKINQKTLSLYTISVSSLKRFLGKNLNKHHLNKHKKEGLAIYLGYNQEVYHIHSWEDFQKTYTEYLIFWHHWQAQSIKLLNPHNEELTPHYQQESSFFEENTSSFLPVIHQAFLTNIQLPPKPAKKNQLFFKIFLLLIIISLSGFWLYKRDTTDTLNLIKNTGKAKIKIVKQIEGENISTVWVAYDVRDLGLDSIRVYSKYADTYPKEYITHKPIDTLSFIFNKPGGGIVLSHKNTELSYTGFYQKTTGWIGWMHSTDFIGACYPTSQIQKNGILSYSSEMIPQKYKDYYFTTLVNQQDFGIKGDNMTLETKIKLVHKPIEATCNELNIQFGDAFNNSKTTFDLKGCEYWTGLSVGTTEILPPRKNSDSQQTQLIPFTHSLDSLQKWNTFKITLKNKKATYYWNDKEFFTLPFNGNIGHLKKIAFVGKGSWAIDWIKLKDEHNRIIYQDDFND